MRLSFAVPCAAALVLLAAFGIVPAQKPPAKERPPHGQDSLPGPALSPADAIKKMKVPEGFSVELVASEPQIVNPVAMTFDERGRVWITESLEYPRRSAGKGRDRVKVIDIGPDGKAAKVTVFADGLNIPSGIAVGHGGVWVANSPDILFYKIGPDGKAAGKPEVVVTGFGRTDTHELPNSLVWGPDGWLYGLNGVFNHSHVKHRGKDYHFTCAMFRIHPKTRDFQLFCEGTSNPWGIAFDPEGSAFVSACVIDHLWHLTETGYYHRQGGPYPPFTWILGSIVKHRHQKAAYCGLHYFDSDAYPKEYRDRLYMGNIHGGCINSDILHRDGSTYAAVSAPDFLTANDQWFMPVSQKTGPDGSLYILDWYDRYHCYQDANRDPKGIDRTHGRLYRVRYKDTLRAGKFNLAKESDDALIERLSSPNVYFRDVAQRLLTERASPEISKKLQKLILDDKAPRKGRMHALWALIGGGPLDPAFHQKLFAHSDPGFRAWGVRAAGNMGRVKDEIRDKVVALAKDPSPDVQLQVAIAVRKMEGTDPLPILVEVLASCGDDKLIPGIVWQNLLPLMGNQTGKLLAVVKKRESTPNLGRLLPRVVERIVALHKPNSPALTDLFELVTHGKNTDGAAARQMLAVLAAKIQSAEIPSDEARRLRGKFLPRLLRELEQESSALRIDAALLAATWKDEKGLKATRALLSAKAQHDSIRVRALEALVSVRDGHVLETAHDLLGESRSSVAFRGQVLSVLGRLEDDKVAAAVLAVYAKMEPDLQPRAIELLTQRGNWGKALLKAIADKKLSSRVINVNHARRLLSIKDPDLPKLVSAHWGKIREERNPEREKVVARMRTLLQRTQGDPMRGIAVYKNLCGQCHKIHGEGVEVGPDITSNGRASFEQLLSNVFDPSLVIGPGYQAVTVVTRQGRTLTGLLVEDSTERVVLKVQGGKQEVVARRHVESVEASKLSLMPEGIENQLKPQEIADLFAFLVLDKHPRDKTARIIQGTPRGLVDR
jgi:putative heme-binding domain-containing protein